MFKNYKRYKIKCGSLLIEENLSVLLLPAVKNSGQKIQIRKQKNDINMENT